VLLSMLFGNTVFLTIDVISVLHCPREPGKQTVTIIRVVVDYSLFIIAALILCYCIIKVGFNTK